VASQNPRAHHAARVAARRSNNRAGPFAFFEDGTFTGTQVFYQLTVLEVFPDWPDNAEMARHALRASQDLEPILNATPEGVGWSLAEDLRPA
jgi:hypothetical protein